MLCFAWLYLITVYDVIFIIRFIFVFITYISLIMCKVCTHTSTCCQCCCIGLGLQPNHACSWLGTWLAIKAIVGFPLKQLLLQQSTVWLFHMFPKKTATGAYWWQPKKKIEDVNVVLNGAILLLKEVHFLESIALFGFHVATVVLRWAVSVAQYQNRGTRLPDHFFRGRNKNCQ